MYSVTNYDEMVSHFNNTIETEQYTTKCLADNFIKLNFNNIYRSLVNKVKLTMLYTTNITYRRESLQSGVKKYK